jgi:hypothetical protein
MEAYLIENWRCIRDSLQVQVDAMDVVCQSIVDEYDKGERDSLVDAMTLTNSIIDKNERIDAINDILHNIRSGNIKSGRTIAKPTIK